jgi:hypothetical protein
MINVWIRNISGRYASRYSKKQLTLLRLALLSNPLTLIRLGVGLEAYTLIWA